MQNFYLTILLCCTIGIGRGNNLVLRGEMGNLKGDKVYLCEVVDEYYSRHRIIDSAVVKEGKFVFQKENIKPELYFLETNAGVGGYLFLESVTMEVKPGRMAEDMINWVVVGSSLDQKYRDYLLEKNKIVARRQTDSLTDLFFKAREKEDEQEMARLKEESVPYYEKADREEYVLTEKWMKANKANEFGIYLYYSKMFRHKSFPTLEKVKEEQAYLSGFGDQAKKTNYFTRMEEQLALYAGCAIGSEAPEIVGLDTAGQMLKLSDLRGKYVIVDFWNSYCHWCREETPWLLEALTHFKNGNLAVLGVSSDRVKKLWINAIHEDKSAWYHLMLQREDQVMDRYCIKGIPHLVLVDPQGKILAKDFRQKDILPLLEKMMGDI
ncbi:MAG: TlpA disulfide reductase family protein [Odoribacter sp.]